MNKILLFTAFTVGLCGIVFLKWQSYPIYWTIGWPICTIVVYWITMLAVNDNGLYEIVGDNCYYLGFVFTLASLAVTLYLLHRIGDVETQDQLPIREVISGFGIALSSTIVGIVLRVLMLRMAPDIAQQESEVRVDLDLAIRDFRTHLSMSIGELKRYSVETSQLLAEQRSAAQEALVQGMETHRKALEVSAGALTGFSEETEKRLLTHEQAASIAEIARKELEAAKALIESMAGLSKESSGLDAVLARLAGQFEKVEDGIARNLEPAIGRISEATTRISSTLEISAGKLKEAAEGFESAAERTEAADVQTNIADAVERLEDANAALAAAIGKLDNLLGRRSLWRRMFGSRSR